MILSPNTFKKILVECQKNVEQIEKNYFLAGGIFRHFDVGETQLMIVSMKERQKEQEGTWRE